MIKKTVMILIVSFFLMSMGVADELIVKCSGNKRPVLVKRVAPTYPAEALKNKIGGNVLIEAITNREGKIEQVKVVKSPEDSLSKAAIDAVKKWVYKPYIVDGKPNKVKFTVNVAFMPDKGKE